jgi:hypothetical protein
MHTKQWLQIVGGGLMLAGITGGRTVQFWHPKMFLAGALIFLSTFITWKRKGNDDDVGTGAGS